MAMTINWKTIAKKAEGMAQLPPNAPLHYEVTELGNATSSAVYPAEEFKKVMWALYESPKRIVRVVIRSKKKEVLFLYDRTLEFQKRMAVTQDAVAVLQFKELSETAKATIAKILSSQLKEYQID